MERNIYFYAHFRKKMFVLALITGLLIALSMPLTYLGVSMSEEKQQASHHSRQVARDLVRIIKQEPELWQYNVPKFLETSSKYHEGPSSILNNSAEIGSIKVIDSNSKEVHKEIIAKPFLLDIRSRTTVVYNNTVFGYVETTEQVRHVIMQSLILFSIFSCLGLLVGWLLYKFPGSIVMQAEAKIKEVFYKLSYLSYHDQLTGLPNRLKFNNYLSELLKQAVIDKKKVAVMFLDLDRFKLINDTMGHDKGDAALKQASRRLRACLRNNDVIARVGGDEFTIILPHITEIKEISTIAKRIISSLSEPILLDGYEFYITVSVGISIYPIDGHNSEILLQKADKAMYRAKELGRGKYQFNTISLDKETACRLKLESCLRGAIKTNKGILVYYQPICNVNTGEVEGVEALVRLKDEDSIVLPGQFISIAEETGLIIPLGEWVLRTACRQMKSWQEQGLPSMYVSINVSERQFQQNDIVKLVRGVLNETGIDPKQLQLEVTENVTLFNEDFMVAKLMDIKKLGVRIAIDDFGTGYSSLNRLKQCPVNCLKIDKSFIDNIPEDLYDSSIVTAIINLAHSLKINVVAEGVEQGSQLKYLFDHQCDSVQGYRFSKPLNAKQFEKYLQDMQPNETAL